ncbi:unnamed protein product [Diatraea saccharalis]|uniref:Organic cation transporter protein-like n=1 Tax=Diatraea saccharalis TaxID=40085 RepID=A0A9N9WER2_9NEOP|nr:unnamed protein product [Diatraea saccharalis]
MPVDFKRSNKKSGKVYELWEILEKFGSYQLLQYLYICLPTVFITMGHINYVFVVQDVGYRCRIPECDNLNPTFQVEWWPNNTLNRCSKPILKTTIVSDFGNCSAENFSEETGPCDSWIYESNNSVVTELNLACKSWHINSVGTIHNLGMLLAMLVTGWIADRFGRKHALVFSMLISSVGLFKIFATSYYLYVSIEFLEALLGGGSYSIAMVLMIEITGRKQRILSGVLFAYAIYMGESLFAVIAMFVHNWKKLVLITYVPPIFCILLTFLLHESPRWLILNGKTKQAITNLTEIANKNKMKVNMQDFSDIDANKLKEKFNIENYETKEGLKAVFTSIEMMKRLMVASFCRFTSNFVYYGIMINSVWLPGDKYVNFLLSTVMSFPGELISLYLMNKIGRKLPLIVGFIFCGGLCILSAFVPATLGWAKILLFLSGKVVMSACFTGAITYCMELFPTSARGSLLGLCAFAARLGGMLAPLTPVLNDISEILPALCFGASSVITGFSIILTPETKHLPLMDTIEQVETSVRKTREKCEIDNSGFVNDEKTFTKL